MYTSEQLEDRSMTKAKMAEIILGLQNTVASTTGGPITSSKLIERKLQLAELTTNTTKEIATIKAEADIAIARIKNDAEIAISRKMEVVISEFESIKSDVSDFEKATESEIAVKEAEAQEIIAKLDLQVVTAQDACDRDLEELKQTVKAAKLDNEEALLEIGIKHDRDLDALKYKNSQAIRDEDAEFVVRAADKAGLALVKADEYAELKAKLEVNNEEIAVDKEKAVSIAVNSAKSKHKEEMTNVKHESELQLSKLSVENEAMTARVQILVRDNDKLQEQVAQIPTMIKESVAAARAEVTVQQDASKK